jgi:hypothetical protein
MLSLPHARVWLILGWVLIAAIVVGSLIPQVPTFGIGISDKVEHFTSYFVLMLWFSGLYERRQHWLLALAFFLMGAALELLQGALTTTREMDIDDALTNGAGVMAAFLVARFGLSAWARRVEDLWTRGRRSREGS